MNLASTLVPDELRNRRERRIEGARRLADLIHVSIFDGEATGPLVEAELQVAHRTSRNTVRDALDLLRREGLVERVPGVGTFAVARQSRHVFDRLQGLAEGIEHGRSRVVHELLTIQTIPASAIVAAELDIEVGAPTLLIERRSYIDGEPIAVGTHWLPPFAAEALRGTDLTSDFYALYEDVLGLVVARCKMVVEAVSADEGTAEQLRVPDGAALLRFERHVSLADGRTVEFGFMRCRGDRLALASSISRDPGVASEVEYR